jgi:D-alanyl-D-alanine carboxypeptidase
MPPSLRDEARALVRDGVPGVVVVVTHDGRTTRIAAGRDFVEARRGMRATDRFRIGSITKSFVATAVLQLAGEGKLRLEDSVEHWLPGLVPKGETITVRELLQHTSGLFDYAADQATYAPFASDPSYAWTPRALVATATRHPPNFEPGTGWGYSNTNYVLLGLIVEAATGQPIGSELDRRIFRPLHLWATSFETDGRFGDRAGAGLHARVAHGYADFGTGRLDATDLNPSWGYAAGAIASTATDVIAFYSALMRGTLLERPNLAAMETTVPIGHGASYGLGLLRRRLACGTFWGHDGGMIGYTSNALVSPDGRRAAVVLANRGRLDARQETLFQQLTVRAACEAAR